MSQLIKQTNQFTQINTSKTPNRNNGVIYYLYCKKSKKAYVGQAANYVSGNKKWGTDGRWRSHLSEAYNDIQNNHCPLLNAAIRKYTADAFIVVQVAEVPLNMLDRFETCCIKSFGTLRPKGYNVTTGGSKKTFTEESRKKMSESRKGTKKKPEDVEKSRIGQIGNRRGTKIRKYPEDANLPKYIRSIRDNGKICGYFVDSFPIGITEAKYAPSKSFTNRNNPQDALNNAIQHVKTLEKQYANITDQIKDKRQKDLDSRATLSYIDKVKKKLPQYIFPIVENHKIVGYYVEGVPRIDEDPCPKKDFRDLSSNQRNLRAAKRYIKSIEVENDDKQFVERADDLPKGKFGNRLPLHITSVFVKDTRIGYAINNFPMSKNVRIKKKFCDTHHTLRHKFELTCNYLRQLMKEKQAGQVHDMNNDPVEEQSDDESDEESDVESDEEFDEESNDDPIEETNDKLNKKIIRI